MKNLFLISIILFCATMLFGQDTVSFITKEYYVNDFIHYKNDSFLVVHKTENYSSDMMESEKSFAYLYGIKEEVVDLLISSENEIFDEYEGIEVENSVGDYAQDYISSTLYPPDDSDYMEGMKFEYFSNNRITHIKDNVVELSYSYWSFEGGAHGSGWANYQYFDLDSEMFFVIDEVFTKEGFDFIYEEVKKDFFESDGDQLEYFVELDKKTSENRTLKDSEYYFTNESFFVEIQMYQSLYNLEDFYIGYNNYSLEIPWVELKRYMIKGNPVERMLDKKQ